MTTTEYLKVWVFTLHNERKEISFIVDTNEAQARDAMARRGVDVTGWDAATKAIAVECGPPVDPDAEPRAFRVVFSRVQTTEVEIKAGSEDEAVDLAREELKENHREYDWDTDGDGDFESVEEVA